MSITAEQVRHVADLARLRIAEGDVDKLARQLAAILAYMQTLEQVDTHGVPATSHAVDLTNAFREDQRKPSLPREDALANAPDPRDGGFGVPKVITAA
jgi:aspartyl-tRNA(Asn)/glutamyl-tRNA(Gln) amidotransferase subunit C